MRRARLPQNKLHGARKLYFLSNLYSDDESLEGGTFNPFVLSLQADGIFIKIREQYKIMIIYERTSDS